MNSFDFTDFMDELDQTENPDSEMEFDQLKDIYLKLKYLYNLFTINFVYQYNQNYTNTLSIFLDQVESTMKYYICDDTVCFKYNQVIKIKVYPIKKLKLMLEIFEHIVPEDEIYNKTVEDDDFLRLFTFG